MLVGMLAARKNPKHRTARLRDPERTRERLLRAACSRDLSIGFPERKPGRNSGVCRRHQGSAVPPFQKQGSLGICRGGRDHLPRRPRHMGAAFTERQGSIGALISIVQGISVRPEDVCGGCELNNLAQEMSPLMRDSASGWRQSSMRGARPLPPFCDRARPTEAFAATWNPLTPPGY